MTCRYASLVVPCVIAAVSCGGSPAAPTVTAAVAQSPSNGAQVAYASQPLTLTVQNAAVTGGGSVSYTFEVATDSGFASKVATREVAQGTGGTTSAVLEVLAGGREYHWHVRASSGSAVGAFGETARFTIGPAVTIGAPTPAQPTGGGSPSATRPTLVVTNAAHTGPVGPLVYRFDIATNSSFTPVLQSGTTPEGNGTTSFVPSSDLPADGTFYWRAQAVDATNNVTGAYSAAQTFSTITTIDLRTVNYQRFVNLSGWPETNRILNVDQDGGDGHMCVDHAKSNLWPTSDFFNDPAVQVEGNQWYFARINGQWYGGSGEWLRKGQTCKSGQYTEFIGPDGTWGGPMDTWRPKVGELVGYLVSTPARDWPNFKTLDERSNVVLVPWRDNRGAAAPVRR